MYNNEEILNDYLLKSLNSQTTNYELILIDNTQKKFKSAAEAFNQEGKKAKGKYIIFTHQDVDLCSNTFLNDLELILDPISNLGIAGVAGKSKEKVIISNIKEGIPPKFSGKIQIDTPVKVQTLDECLFIIPKNVFDMVPFDEEVCNGWHLYAVDYSLSVNEKGRDVYVVPASIYHKSAGDSFSKEYYSILKKLLNKHRKNYKMVYTTMGNWDSEYPLSIQKIFQRSIFYWTKFKKKF
ncbi:glycosyltransferase [Methanobacterium sp.]|uniref:glycosyltransferase n=1 Tax=Methanobacterium sp. TaxID=2164 RepID=UPI0031583239